MAIDTIIADTQAWLTRAVIGLNLCPFAKAVHVKNQIAYRVSLATEANALLQDLELALQALQAAPVDEIETTLLMAPHFGEDFIVFNDFLQIAERALKRLRLVGEIQIASFHPRYVFAGEEEGDMSHYSNRAPYPTLHLLREDSIDRAVIAIPEPDAIYEANIARLRAMGLQAWQALDVGAHL